MGNRNLNDLEEKLKQFRAQEQARSASDDADDEDAENMSIGIRAGSELVVSIAAGTLIGWGLDKWLHTKPAFLIIFILAGIFTGFMNVYRITQNIGGSVGFAALHNREKPDTKTPEN